MQSLFKSLEYYLSNPINLITKYAAKGIIPMSDEAYIKAIFKQRLGYKLNLVNPQTFNEKLQWLKLYDRNPEYTKMVDKYAVKQHVAGIIGVEHIIPTLGVWDKFDEIDFDALPNQFVLKCTHDSGGLVIVQDKSKIDKKAIRMKIETCLKTNYYLLGREWAYKDVPRRIIAEKYMVEESGYDLKDYKVFCFNGEPKIIQVDYNRYMGHKRNLYTTTWDYINKEIEYPTDINFVIKKPSCLDYMFKIARALSKDIPHVRSDFYVIGEKVYFGELTLYHGSGFEKFNPESFGLEMGNYLKLPNEILNNNEN